MIGISYAKGATDMTTGKTPLVYVIIGTEGEYSDRQEWVAGVFTDKAEAVRVAEEKIREIRAAQATFDHWIYDERPKHPDGRRTNVDPQEWADKMQEVLAGIEEADDYTVIEVPINTFGRFREIDTP